jgi:hypothetical protein
MAPVYVGGVLVLASVGVAIAMVLAKNAAQDKADSTASDIKHHGGTCPAPANTTITGLAEACKVYSDDINAVNNDATIGNVAVGVGVAALVGTFVYWIAASKRDETVAVGSTSTVLVPTFGKSSAGLSLSGSF